ncbi:MAG TPA: head-tail connector protein [Firmicutes bacterium]|nr:head-tail connector protein [Bacillota bacterium]
MLISIEEARDTLRIDGTDNDAIITSLLEAIPAYLEAQTGKTWTDDAIVHPLAQTAARFILQLWYDPLTVDSDRLKKVIDSLVSHLSIIARRDLYNG